MRDGGSLTHGAPGIGCQEADGYIGAWHARGGRGGSEGRAACGLLTTWCREENLSTADPEVAKKEVAKKEGCQETVLGLGNKLLLGQGMENPRTLFQVKKFTRGLSPLTSCQEDRLGLDYTVLC